MITFNLECLLKKEQSCQSNPERSYTEKKTEHEPSGYSWDLVCSFDPRENKHNFYRGDSIEKFCKDLKELATEIIYYEEKEMVQLTGNKDKFYKEQKEFYICKKEFCYDKMRKINLHYTRKLEIIIITLENLEKQLIVFAT